MSKEAVSKMIKSCIVSRKGGIPMAEIENDYRELVGQSIPYLTLGYRTLQDFIRSIDFVNVRTNYLGDTVLCVSDPKIAHIESLVSKQKNSSNRNVGSKQKRRNRWGKSRQGNNKVFGDNRASNSRRRYEKYNKTDNYRPEKFSKNTRMAYTQSKWYSDRPKDSWKQKRIESRESDRFNNFNARRTNVQNTSHNSSLQNDDNAWSGRTASQSSTEENMYNFHSQEEQRYAQESRRWKFQVADDNKSTVGKSQQQTYNRPQEYNMFDPGQSWGGPTNNCNFWWRDANHNAYQNWTPLDIQSGLWWLGHQGCANGYYPWMQFRHEYPGQYPWNNRNPSQFPTY